MKKIFFPLGIFTFCILLISFLLIQDLFKNEINNVLSQNHQAREIAESKSEIMSKALSLPFANRLKDYLEASGFTKYGAGNGAANDGLIEYNNRVMSENPCFAEIVSKFYLEIKIRDLENLIKIKKNGTLDNPKFHLKSRPSLLSKVGDELNPDQKPGWLWDKALRFADGDKNLAFQILGVCGNDDAPPAKMNFASVNTSDFTRQVSILSNEFVQTISDHEQKDQVKKSISASVLMPSCPGQLSSMYFPGSLGAKYDLPNDFKKRLEKIQAPTMGGYSLPGKYYHVMGAAFTSCLMLRRGIPGFIGDTIQTKSIQAYRSNRLCSMINRQLENGKSFDLLNNEKSINTISNLTQQDCLKPEITRKPECLIRSRAGYSDGFSFEQVKERVQKELYLNSRNSDAIEILKNHPNFISIANCSDIKLSNIIPDTIHQINEAFCPRNWTNDKCKTSINTLQTWAVDFEWSEKSHEVGSDFAKDNCPFLPSDTSPFKNSCIALEKLKQSDSAKYKKSSQPISNQSSPTPSKGVQ